MAMTPYLHFTTFPSISSPLLFSKPHHSPFTQPPYLFAPQFNRYTFLSVSSRQNQKPFAVNFSSQIVYAESSSSSNTREPMLPPYNVLITGSTKGQLFLKLMTVSFFFYFFNGFFCASALLIWSCSLSFDLGFLNFFLGFIYFGCFVGNLCVICLLSFWGLTIWCKCYISCVVLCQCTDMGFILVAERLEEENQKRCLNFYFYLKEIM